MSNINASGTEVTGESKQKMNKMNIQEQINKLLDLNPKSFTLSQK